MTYDNYSHLDDETRKLIQQAENLVKHVDLGFSDMGEIEGRNAFYEYMQKKDVGYKLPFASKVKDFLIAPNELTLLSGYTGAGKTELVNQLLLECLAQGAKGVITSLELTPNQLKKRLYQQSTGLKTQTIEQNNSFHNFYAGKLKYWNGSKMQKIVELLAVMKKFYLENGCDVFVLDNMMMLGAKPDDLNRHYETVFLIKEFCKTYPVHVFLVAHPRKPKENYYLASKANQPYYFDVPSIYDVSGSATIANLVDNYLAIGENLIKKQAWIDIANEKVSRADRREVIENYGDVLLKRGKRREHGKTFDLELFYDFKFRRYKENTTESLQPYLCV